MFAPAYTQIYTLSQLPIHTNIILYTRIHIDIHVTPTCVHNHIHVHDVLMHSQSHLQCTRAHAHSVTFYTHTHVNMLPHPFTVPSQPSTPHTPSTPSTPGSPAKPPNVDKLNTLQRKKLDFSIKLQNFKIMMTRL